MKSVKTRKTKEGGDMHCALCQANFQVWVDNLKVNPEKEDALRKHFLSYCPVCTRKDEKN